MKVLPMLFFSFFLALLATDSTIVTVFPYPCTSDNDCPSYAYPYCNTVSSQCEPCSGSPSSCLHLDSSSSCIGSTCIISCTSNADCKSMRAFCNSGICSQCSSHADCDDGTGIYSSCTMIPAGVITTFGICSSCGASDTCSTGVCANYKCVECNGDPECPTGKVCDIQYEANICVECTQSSHCTGVMKSSCSISSNTCQICSGPSDCGHISGTSFCDPSLGCVECLVSTDCPLSKPICSSSGTCIECTQNSHCTSALKSSCNTGSNTCQICSTPSGCSHLAGTNVCHSSVGCVECTQNTDCTNAVKSSCSSHTCQTCSTPSDCSHILPAGQNLCIPMFGCGECNSVSDCASSLKPVCLGSKRCGCSQNSDCLGVFASYCNTADTCEVCTSASDCTHLVNTPVCLVGTGCVECLTNSDCQKTSASSCNLGTRVCEACTMDSQCSHLTDLNVCSVSEGKCIAAETKTPSETLTTTTTMETTVTMMTIVSASMFFLGSNPAILWALLSLLQAFYYLIFINVDYPQNVQEFFGIFSMGSFSFLPNPFGWIVPTIENISLPAPKKFIENDVNGFFLGSSGESLLLWALILIFYMTSKLFIKYTRNMPNLLTTICTKMVGFIEWSGVFRTAIASYTDLTMDAFLQLRVMNYEGGEYFASSIFAVFCAGFTLACPVLVYYVIRKYHRHQVVMKKKYQTLVEEYRMTDRIPKYFVLLFLLKRLVMISTLVFLHDYPYIEIFFLLANCFVWALLLWKYSPYEGALNNWINLISEVLFVVIHIFIAMLIFDKDHSWFADEERTKVGWAIIAACIVIICGSLVLSIIENYKTIKELITLVRKLIKGKPKGVVKPKKSPPPRVQIFPESYSPPLSIPKINIEPAPVISTSSNLSNYYLRDTESNRMNTSVMSNGDQSTVVQLSVRGRRSRHVKREIFPKRKIRNRSVQQISDDRYLTENYYENQSESQRNSF